MNLLRTGKLMLNIISQICRFTTFYFDVTLLGNRHRIFSATTAENLIQFDLLLRVFLHRLNLYLFLFYCLAQQGEDAHIEVCDIHQCKTSYNITLPPFKQQLEVCQCQESYCNIVAETILAGKQVKEFSPEQCPGVLTAIDTVFPWFTEYLFVGNGPCDAGNRYGQNK